ncbi:transformer-2 protein homolog beta-like isoform X2 [Gigantopelta aegis]|uniref:transformer-2 protein homolog beta-like isoform X2 n=1 Tax=Gigantopelta aegis TaxID=1735272 RepID=UPI001B88C297|nr:transformer-2 protein homolog beta-like isoform X2 [Gigantopelta aegis]
MSSRRRHIGNRDDPEPTRCLGVFGLSLHTQDRELRDVFARYGSIDECNIVYDRQSGRSRGFAFVYFRNVDDAVEAKDRCNGLEIDGRRIRVDYSITERAHTPTPGIYLGKPTSSKRSYRSPSPQHYSYRRRSPSPYYRRRSRTRSRSRSYSPRRY